MEEKKVKYAIGQQDFKILRERGAIYVDKTMFVRKIVEDGSQYFFLARPRRFGKSLFLSTLRYFYEGNRDLFKALMAGRLKRTNLISRITKIQKRYRRSFKIQ
ncbi:MAG: AAA family ATPase [Muribaculaceae bacterium]|nr:AAA family ATPase [Muribaculaceae bacterium]